MSFFFFSKVSSTSLYEDILISRNFRGKKEMVYEYDTINMFYFPPAVYDCPHVKISIFFSQQNSRRKVEITVVLRISWAAQLVLLCGGRVWCPSVSLGWG